MKTNIILSNPKVLQDSPAQIHVLVEVTAPSAPTTDRAPLDIVVVADRSGSMSGGKLHGVREAIVSLLRQMTAQDRLGVVVFDTDVDVILELGGHTASDAVAKIRSIECGGSTNLSGGWLKACEILTAERRPEAISRIVLLTDGQANAGVVEPDAVATMTAGAAKLGITTSTIGFGTDYDETFLALVADAGRGNDYFCSGPDQALTVFATEFDGLASVVAQNISVVAAATNDATQVRLINQQVTETDGRRLVVNIGDAYGEEARTSVLEFVVAPQSEAGLKHIADVTVRYASVVGDAQLHEETFPVEIEVTPDFAAVGEGDPRVLEQVRRLLVEDVRLRSLDAARSGDYETSDHLMSEVLDELTELGAPESELEDARKWLSVRGPKDALSMKVMYSMSRSSSRGRRKRFDPDNP